MSRRGALNYWLPIYYHFQFFTLHLFQRFSAFDFRCLGGKKQIKRSNVGSRFIGRFNISQATSTWALLLQHIQCQAVHILKIPHDIDGLVEDCNISIGKALENSPHKGSVTRKMFPFDDVIMCSSRSKQLIAAEFMLFLGMQYMIFGLHVYSLQCHIRTSFKCYGARYIWGKVRSIILPAK